jgi:hypothetical protein
MFLLFFGAIGCQYDPYATDLTIKEPALKDIFGTYYFEEQTVRNIDGLMAKKDASINLNADGTYLMTNIPDLTGKQNMKDIKLISAWGQWEMTTVSGVDNGWGHVKQAWGIRLTAVTESLSTIGFMGEAPNYKLIITYGDPDAGTVMIFAKK